jgi:hypothetical protein
MLQWYWERVGRPGCRGMGGNVPVVNEGNGADQFQGDVGPVHRLVCALGRLLAIDQLIQDREYSEISQAISKFAGREVAPLRFGGFVSFDDELTADDPEVLDATPPVQKTR